MSPDARPGSAVEGQRAYPWLGHYPEGVDWNAQFEPLAVHELLERAVQKFGSRPCTNFFGKTLTYQEIGQLAGKAAAGLQGLGVRQGTKVGLFLPNCPTYLIYYFGILKAGGIVVNYNPLYTLEELTFQLADSHTELLVTLDLKAPVRQGRSAHYGGRVASRHCRQLFRPAARDQIRALLTVQKQGPGPP